MIDVETVNAASTITLLEAIEALYPMLALIQVFLDNARYHHAKLVQEWLARPDCRIKLHFIPTYCPHLNPIERLWGLMHRNVTHNKTYATCAQFADAALDFLREGFVGDERVEVDAGMVSGIVNYGLVTVFLETFRVGGKMIKVRMVRITIAGRHALAVEN